MYTPPFICAGHPSLLIPRIWHGIRLARQDRGKTLVASTPSLQLQIVFNR
jgi:hypothetical protein